MGVEAGVGLNPALRWTWATGAVLLVAGLLLSLEGDFIALYPGLLALAAVGGVTAACGRRAGVGWLVAAWSVPMLPLVLALGAFGYLAYLQVDPTAVVILLYVTAGVWVGVMVVFAVALVVGLTSLHLRRRRFGEPRPAWENDPTPPPYS